MTNIALVGAPGSGKTEIAKRWGHRLGFAQALKEECARALFAASGIYDPRPEALSGFIEAQQSTDAMKELYRPLWQWWGTEYRRANDANYWVRQLGLKIDAYEDQMSLGNAHPDSYAPVTVDDCRFPNEYDMLKSRGFKFIRLHGGPHERNYVPHPSEDHWQHFPVDADIPYMDLGNIVDAITEQLEGAGNA